MLKSPLKACAVIVFANLTIVGHALASPSISSIDSARLIIQVQDEENKEVWQDLRPDVTPPEAAVGNEGQASREREKATNLIDCEKVGGMWDVANNRCIEKK